jgi:hypothetical protein
LWKAKGGKAKETTEIAHLFNAKTDLEENLCPHLFSFKVPAQPNTTTQAGTAVVLVVQVGVRRLLPLED